jgi:hypothetical protein
LTVLFAAAQLGREDWARLPFQNRVEMIKSHYELAKWPHITTHEWFFPETGVGIFVACQQPDLKNFRHFSPGRTPVFVTHFPFGYKAVVPGTPLESIGQALCDALSKDGSLVTKLAPPLAVLRVDEERGSFDFWNDVLGLGKTFLHETSGGKAISSRPIAAHLLAASVPAPDDMGWASEQIRGWFVGPLTPYRNTRRVLGGTSFSFDRGGVFERHENYAGRWFTQPPERDTFRAFPSFIDEFNEFTTPNRIDVALSGGRDSRASAALAACYFPTTMSLRTNEPPTLEVIVARNLVERLPFFGAFNDRSTVATDVNQRVLWRANTPKVAETEIHGRAAGWALNDEGIAASAALYRNSANGVFQQSNEFIPSISGVAGESAKAYYWSPRMASGAFARSMQNFMEDTKNPVEHRLLTHPLTKPATLPFIARDFHLSIDLVVQHAKEEASHCGIHGYRFLDYWWLTDRFGAGATVGYSGTTTIMPFMVPEYIAQAMQQPVASRARAQFLNEIVKQYRPEWDGIPYFDEAQATAPPEQVRYYPDRGLRWRNGLKPIFMSMLRDSPAFDAPYDRAAMVTFFEDVRLPESEWAGLNQKALGLVHRHAFCQVCANVGAKIRIALA